MRAEAEEKPPDVPGTESGRTGGVYAEGPPQAEHADGSADTGAAAAQDKKKPAAMQGALAGAERQEALLCAKEALLRLRRAGVSAAEAHALIKQLFGEAEKGEKR